MSKTNALWAIIRIVSFRKLVIKRCVVIDTLHQKRYSTVAICLSSKRRQILI